MIAALCLALLAFGSTQHYVVYAACDASCQLEQRSFLQTLYGSLSGTQWTKASGWTTDTAGSVSNGSVPFHCSWQGVICCSQDGFAYVPVAYTTPIPVACTEPGAVAALYLPENSLAGSLPDDTSAWQAL